VSVSAGSDSESDAGDDRNSAPATDWDARAVTLRRITVGDILIGANGLSLLEAYSAKELSQRIAAAAQSSGGRARSGSIRLDFCAAANADAGSRDGAVPLPAAGAHCVGERHAVLFRIVAASAVEHSTDTAGASARVEGGGADDRWLDAVGRAVAALAVRESTVLAWRRAFARELAAPSASREGALCARFIAPGGRFDALEQSAVAELGRYRRRAERFAAQRSQPTWRAEQFDLAPPRECRRLWMAWREAKDPVAQMQQLMDDVAARLVGQLDDDEVVGSNAMERDDLRHLYGDRRRALRWEIGASAGLHLRPASERSAADRGAPAAELGADAAKRDALLALAQDWALAALERVWRRRPRFSAEQSAGERALREARLAVECTLYVQFSFLLFARILLFTDLFFSCSSIFFCRYVPLEKRVLRLLAEREEIDAYFAAALEERGDAPSEVLAAAAAAAARAGGGRGLGSSAGAGIAREQTPLPRPRSTKRRSEHVGWSPMREVMVRRSSERLLAQTQAYFGIPDSHRSPTGFAAATAALREIDDPSNRLPSEKLACLLRAARAINSAAVQSDVARRRRAEELGPAGRSGTHRQSLGTGADVFLPIHVWVVVQARLRAPLLTSAVLSSLCSADSLAGEAGYYLVAFQSALAFIEDEPG
jgi:hypothetical protein